MIEIHHFTFNPFQENTYILHDETGECIIIDPGCYEPHEEKELSDYIEEKGLTPVRLINTHCHVDHVLGNEFVASKYSLGLEIHELDLVTLQAAVNHGILFGIKVTASPAPASYMKEGDVITFGNSSLRILFVPGHAPGHIVLVCDEQQFLIGGDVLFYGSIGRTDLPGGDHATLIDSIKSKIFPLEDNYRIYPGHGPSTTVGFEKDHNPFLG